jgi:hypothetical protein
MTDVSEPPINPSPPLPQGSSLEDVLPTMIEVLTDPRAFFSSMPREGGYEAPGLFAIIMLLVHAVITGVFALLHLRIFGFVAALIFVPLFGAIGLAIGTIIVLLLSRALRGEATLESSFRIGAYSAALLPLAAIASIVPYLPILVEAYGIYIFIVAVIATHKVEEQRAWTVLGGIGAVVLLLALLGTATSRRVGPKLERLGHELERNAEQLKRAAEELHEQGTPPP